MSRDSFFVSGAECSRGRVCLRGMGLSPGMSHADASIRKSGPEIKNRCTDCPCFDLFAASILKSGLEIKNRCTVCPCFDLLAALIRKSGLEIGNRCTEVPGMMLAVAVIVNSGPEIKNHCSAIVPASRMARLPRP